MLYMMRLRCSSSGGKNKQGKPKGAVFHSIEMVNIHLAEYVLRISPNESQKYKYLHIKRKHSEINIDEICNSIAVPASACCCPMCWRACAPRNPTDRNSRSGAWERNEDDVLTQ